MKIVGDLPIEEDILKSLILIKTGERFNQFLVTETEEIFKNIFATKDTVSEVRGVPDTNAETGEVDLIFKCRLNRGLKGDV